MTSSDYYVDSSGHKLRKSALTIQNMEKWSSCNHFIDPTYDERIKCCCCDKCICDECIIKSKYNNTFVCKNCIYKTANEHVHSFENEKENLLDRIDELKKEN